MRAQLRAASQLPDCEATNLRLDAGAWLMLAQQNVQAQVMLGRVVGLNEMQSYTDMINSILPKADTLTVKFVDNDLGEGEREELRGLRAAMAARKGADASVVPGGTSSPANAPAAKPPPSPPAPPPNVLPLRSVHNHVAAPLKSDEPWRSSIGSEFRRFDTPESV